MGYAVQYSLIFSSLGDLVHIISNLPGPWLKKKKEKQQYVVIAWEMFHHSIMFMCMGNTLVLPLINIYMKKVGANESEFSG